MYVFSFKRCVVGNTALQEVLLCVLSSIVYFLLTSRAFVETVLFNFFRFVAYFHLVKTARVLTRRRPLENLKVEGTAIVRRL